MRSKYTMNDRPFHATCTETCKDREYYRYNNKVDDRCSYQSSLRYRDLNEIVTLRNCLLK